MVCGSSLYTSEVLKASPRLMGHSGHMQDLIPDRAKWVKDCHCRSCRLGDSCGSDPIPGPGTPYAPVQPKRKPNETKLKS